MCFYHEHNTTECSFDKNASYELNILVTLTFYLSVTFKPSLTFTPKVCWQVSTLDILNRATTH